MILSTKDHLSKPFSFKYCIRFGVSEDKHICSNNPYIDDSSNVVTDGITTLNKFDKWQHFLFLIVQLEQLNCPAMTILSLHPSGLLNSPQVI